MAAISALILILWWAAALIYFFFPIYHVLHYKVQHPTIWLLAILFTGIGPLLYWIFVIPGNKYDEK